MASSSSLFKSLRRLGSSRRWSVPSGDDVTWQARYDRRRARDTDDDISDGYSTSVRLILVRPRPDSDQLDNRDVTEDSAQDDESANPERDPPSPSDPCLCQRPLPPLPPPRDPQCPPPPLPPSRRPASRLADDSKVRALSAQLAQLAHQGWYWGPLTLEETNDILEELPDGSYLVRDSHNEAYLLAIGLRADGRTVAYDFLLVNVEH